MTSQPEKQTIAIHILRNISRRKGNQTIKFGQLIEYSMKNIFLKKSYRKFDGKTISRPFSKKFKIEHISRSSLKFHAVSVYIMPS